MSRSSWPRPQDCDLRKSGTRMGGVDIRRECAGTFGPAPPCWSDSAAVLVGLIRALTCADTTEVGMQRLKTYKPSQLNSGGVSRVRAETLPAAGPVPWLGGPCRSARQAGVNCAAGRASAGIFIGRVLWGTSSLAQCLTCGVLARGSAIGTLELPDADERTSVQWTRADPPQGA